MLAVRIAHKHLLKVKKQIGITIQLANLLFTEEFGYGEFVNTITLPAKEINAVTFQSFHTEDARADNNGILLKEKAEIFKDTVKIIDGRFELKEASDSEYGLDVFAGMQGFTFLNDKLSDLLWLLNSATRHTGFNCETQEELIQHAKDQNAETFLPSKYFFPVIKNDFFYGDANPDFKMYLNRWDVANQQFYINPYNDGTGAFNNYDSLCPQMRLYDLINEIFNYYSITVDGEFIDHIDQEDVLVYNNRSLDQSFTMRAVKANNGGQNLGAGGGFFSFDAVDIDTFQIFTIATGTLRIFRPGKIRIKIWLIFTPNPSTNYTAKIFKDGVEVYSQNIDVFSFPYIVNYSFTATADDVNLNLTFSLTNDDGSALSLEPSSLMHVDVENADGGYNYYDTSINMANHVPDITLGELIAKLKKAKNLHIDYNASTATITFNYIKSGLSDPPSQNFTKIASHKYLKKVIPPPVKSVAFEFPDDDDLSGQVLNEIDLTLFVGSYDTFEDLPAPALTGQRAFIRNTSIVVEVIVNPGTTDLIWFNKKWYYPKINYNENGEEDVLIDTTPVLMTIDFDEVGVKSLKPYVVQRGSTPAFNIGNNNNSNLRLLYWKGLQENSTGGLYPLATSGSIDTTGNDLGDFEIRLEGEKGFRENFWGKWYETLNIGIVWTRKFYFNIIHLLNFNINKTFRCGNHSFIPKSGTIEIESKKTMEAQLDYIEVLP